MMRSGLRVLSTAGFVILVGTAVPALAQTAPSLGTAQSYAVLGGSTVTNTGPSVIGGDLGLSPGAAVTGFPPGVVSGGTIHAADAAALSAQNSLTTAYNNAAGQSCTQDLTGQDLGGKTLTPGVYCFATSGALTGTLTLNGQGNPASVFIFKFGSTLTTASGSSVVMINSGSQCNVFWQVGSTATLGTTTSFAGNILALTSINATTGANIVGRALARNGAVTLDTNNITPSSCNPVPTLPEWAFLLLAIVLAGCGAVMLRRRTATA
jgi:Flp pilus assembly protein TadG